MGDGELYVLGGDERVVKGDEMRVGIIMCLTFRNLPQHSHLILDVLLLYTAVPHSEFVLRYNVEVVAEH